MDMTGEYKIKAPRDRVWAALNDPELAPIIAAVIEQWLARQGGQAGGGQSMRAAPHQPLQWPHQCSGWTHW